VTWNNGETERFFARSALAPSKKKLVRWVAEVGIQLRVPRDSNVQETCEMRRRAGAARWGGVW